MLNVDKYRKEIDDYITIEKHLGDIDCKIATLRGIRNCSEFECEACMKESLRWIFSEYKPPLLENGDSLKPGDWIMVRDRDGDKWQKRQFMCYFQSLDKPFVTLEQTHGWYAGKHECWEQARLLEDGE